MLIEEMVPHTQQHYNKQLSCLHFVLALTIVLALYFNIGATILAFTIVVQYIHPARFSSSYWCGACCSHFTKACKFAPSLALSKTSDAVQVCIRLQLWLYSSNLTPLSTLQPATCCSQLCMQPSNHRMISICMYVCMRMGSGLYMSCYNYYYYVHLYTVLACTIIFQYRQSKCNYVCLLVFRATSRMGDETLLWIDRLLEILHYHNHGTYFATCTVYIIHKLYKSYNTCIYTLHLHQGQTTAREHYSTFRSDCVPTRIVDL